MSCGEVERLFLAGASPEAVRRHVSGCATCARLNADLESTAEMSAGLVAPPLAASLRKSLLEIPRRTVPCEGAERLLAFAVEGEIGADDERRLASHLSRCAGCAEAAETLLGSRDLEQPTAPPWLAARLTAARPARERGLWAWILDPKAVIAVAYAAALLVMLLGFNPADLARRVRSGQIGENTRAAVTVAESSLTDRVGALQEKIARTFAIWKGRAGGYGRAAVSNGMMFFWKSSTTKDRGGERSRNRDGRGAFKGTDTTNTSWRA